MPLPALTLILLATAGQAAPPPPVAPASPVVVTGRGGVPFITPMGEPIRARTPNEDTLARWFATADLNHDGYLTPDEMQAYAASYFNVLDTNRDGQIDPDEMMHYEWQVAPEIQVNSRLRRARAPGEATPKTDEPSASGGDDEGKGKRAYRRSTEQGLQGAARYGLLNLPEPVAAADTDFNRAVTLQEFKQAALDRFQLLDNRHQGRLSLRELESIRTAALALGDRAKRRDKDPDARIGSPLPPGS